MPLRNTLLMLSETNAGLAGAHQQMNAALAVSLCKEWAIRRKNAGVAIDAQESAFEEGLRKTTWPGRGQIYVTQEYPSITWFLDGAHTPESMVVGSSVFLYVHRTSRRLTDCIEGLFRMV